jgi:chromosome segregation ATPase
MEQSQLSQMVNWLDQAHQQDRRLLEQLRQQVERLSGGRDETEQRIAALEAQFGLLSAQLERLNVLEGYFERFKEQVNAMLERGEAQRQKALQESDRARQAEIATLMNAVNDFRKEIEKYRRYDEEMAARRVDVQRLSGEIAKLQIAVENLTRQRDDWTRTAGFLEEQRRQDARRVADLQTQIVEVGRRVDGLLPRLQYLEQLSPRLMELRAQLDELRQSQGRDLEKRQFLEAQIDRQIKLWAEEIDTYRQRMDNFERRIEQYAEYHQVVKKATEGLQSFQEQIARAQQESAELLRLSQNRQKTQLEEWQTQQEQRWQKYISEWDRQWADYERALATLSDQITVLSGRVSTLEKRIQLLIQIAEEDAQMRTMAAQEWQTRFEQVMEKEE